MQKLSEILEFSLDDFMSENFSAIQKIEEKEKESKVEQEERISVPTLKVNKFKNVLLYILEQCAGKPNIGEGYIDVYKRQRQGQVCANGIAAIGSGHDVAGKTLILAVFPELYAIIALAVTFLIANAVA